MKFIPAGEIIGDANQVRAVGCCVCLGLSQRSWCSCSNQHNSSQDGHSSTMPTRNNVASVGNKIAHLAYLHKEWRYHHANGNAQN